MYHDDDIPWSCQDIGALPPECWEALKQRGLRRARVERSRALRGMFRCLCAWLRHPVLSGAGRRCRATSKIGVA